MAFELIGIDNENEFYPAAFLTDALEEELKAALTRWREAALPATETPDARLSSVRAGYLGALDSTRTASSAGEAFGIWRRAAGDLVSALGYTVNREAMPTHDGLLVPVVARCANRDGRDQVWVIEAPMPAKDEAASDPLTQNFAPDQFEDADRPQALLDMPIETVLTDAIFVMDGPPRYVIVAGLNQVVLIDRAKWARRSVLRFELLEIFKRAERTTLDAMACLLSREARAPETGVPLADRLEEEAQRHANAVTTSLKRTVRDAIEILGNEVLAVTGGKYPSGKRKGVWIESQDLTIECLRYMYRLLFLFYAEANPRLGIIPLNDEIYRKGYSLEALRGLEKRKLRTQEEKGGTFLWESLQRLLGLMYDGLDRAQIGGEKMFSLPRVRVSLLDPESTPILSNVKLRNEAMQRIIRSLSLKQDKAGTGRISYAQLGIGQLGAVYETLISFTGFVAKTDMIELIPPKGKKSVAEEEAGEDVSAESDEGDEEGEGADEEEQADAPRTDKVDPLAPSYFVTRDRSGEFTRDEIVYDGPQPRIYKKGAFIYRLAGRDRQKSASYYTPEPLARLLVKHALLERCKDMPADDVLDLKILEPAMGSAAFLVEATNQLADIYLERKQDELKRRIPQDQYYEERQKVRAYIADRNCFGVDQNPIAVELGQISLWLNGLHSGEFSPWFGDQLHAGNSLIGARRATYDARLLKPQSAANLWLRQIPTEIGWRGKRDSNHVWQFLLPSVDMAKFESDRSITEFASDAQEAIKAWRRNGFFAPLQEHEIRLLLSLSEAADQLFEAVADDLKAARSAANDEITIWPDRIMPGVSNVDFHAKLARLRVLQGDEHVSNSLPYQRLKTVMDAWCALWLWPLDMAQLLPTRQEYLLGLQAILKGGITQSGDLEVGEVEFAPAQADFVERLERADSLAKDLPSRGKQSALFQQTNIDALISTSPWLKVAREVAARERFSHFDLIFADILKDREGFDLIVGNPPWSKPSWNEGDVIGDIDPAFVVRKLSAIQARQAREAALSIDRDRAQFLAAYSSAKGAMNATGSAALNPFAGGGQNNLYRCFIDLAFRLTAPKGYAALIHQDGHLGDPKSGAFRKHWYARISKHFHFRNEIKSKNFAEVHNEVSFSLNVYRGAAAQVGFEQFTQAFAASQVEDSYAHDGAGPIPAIKNEDGAWSTRGHRQRIINVDTSALAVIHSLSEEAGAPVEEARFIQPYSASMLGIFLKLAAFQKLESVMSGRSGSGSAAAPGWQMSAVWHETNAQRDGTIERSTAFRRADDLVLQGPLFHVGNPLYKTPRAICNSNKAYDVIDLTLVPDDYLPRTNYGPAIERNEYKQRLPRCAWDATKTHLDFNRAAFRKMIALNGERSFIGAILPRGVAHVDSVQSVAFADEEDLLSASAAWSSVVIDFLVKAIGLQNLHDRQIASLPWVELSSTAKHRILRLVCVTKAYSDLWNRHAPNLVCEAWSSDDQRLSLEGDIEGPVSWDRSAALRTEFARRLALLEIDVLVAQAFGINLDQLLEIYRIYFPVLQENEGGTWFDQRGRIVWTCSMGLPGVGYLVDGKSPGRKAWEKIAADAPSELSCDVVDDNQPGGPRRVTRRFIGPFTRHDRVSDYRRAWAHFERLKADGAAA